jgi:hypothetical protein
MSPCEKIVGPCYDANTSTFYHTSFLGLSDLWLQVGAVLIVVAWVLVVLYYVVRAYLRWRS